MPGTFGIQQGINNRKQQQDRYMSSEFFDDIAVIFNSMTHKKQEDFFTTLFRKIDHDISVVIEYSIGSNPIAPTTFGKKIYPSAGSTAILSTIFGKKIYTSNAGDSKSFACIYDIDRELIAVKQLNTRIHNIPLINGKPDATDPEVQRIYKDQGTITFNSGWRVKNTTNIVRAFGNFDVIGNTGKKLIIPDPQVDIDDIDDLLQEYQGASLIQIINVSDGVTDKFYKGHNPEIHQQMLKNAINSNKNINHEILFDQDIADKINSHILRFNPTDNTTIAVKTIYEEEKDHYVSFDDRIILLGVFDGHGGADVAEYLANNMEAEFKEYLFRLYKEKFFSIVEQFLVEKNAANLNTLSTKIAGLIKSSDGLFLLELQGRKNFIDLLLENIKSEDANSGLRAYMLYWIVKEHYHFEGYCGKLLDLLKNLGAAPAGKHVFEALKIILTRRKGKVEIGESIQMAHDIEARYQNGKYLQELLSVMYGKAIRYKSFEAEVVEAFINQNLLELLHNKYCDLFTQTINSDSQLVYGKPNCALEESYLYQETYLLQWLKVDGKHPYSNVQADVSKYKKVKKELLLDLLYILQKFAKRQNLGQEGANYSYSFIANELSVFIFSHTKNPIKPSNLTIEEIENIDNISMQFHSEWSESRENICIPLNNASNEFTQEIKDLRKLGRYYDYLVSIREIYTAMLYGTKLVINLSDAQVFLKNALLGKQEQHPDLCIYNLMSTRKFIPQLITTYIEYISKSKTIAELFTQDFIINQLEYNLLNAKTDEFKNHIELLAIVIDKVKENPGLLKTLLNFRNSEGHDVLYILATTIYKLIASCNAYNYYIRDNIQILLSKFVELFNLAKTSILESQLDQLAKNIFYFDNEIFKLSFNFKDVLATQKKINAVVRSKINGDIDADYLSKPQSYFIVDIIDIEVHLKHCANNMEKIFSDILRKSNLSSDRDQIIDCFIRCQFLVFANVLIKEFCFYQIYSILESSNNFYTYLSNFCSSLEKWQWALGVKNMVTLTSLFLSKLIEDYLLQNVSIIPKISSEQFLCIARKFSANLEQTDLSDIVDRIAVFSTSEYQKIECRKEIIRYLLKEGCYIPSAKQQYIRQSQSPNLKKSVQFFTAYSSKTKDLNFSELLGQFHVISTFSCSEQDELLNIFAELNKFYPKFITCIVQCGQFFARQKNLKSVVEIFGLCKFQRFIAKIVNDIFTERDLYSDVERLAEKMHIVELLSKVVQLQAKDLGKLKEIYFHLSSMNIDTNTKILSIYSECVKIIQNFLGNSQEEKEKFKAFILRDCYKIGEISNTRYYDTNKKELIKRQHYNVAVQKRKNAEFLLEYLDNDNCAIDWPRFFTLCQRLSLEEKLNQENRSYINNFLQTQPVLSYNEYALFILKLEAPIIMLDFNDMDYVYPRAFKKIFSKEKGQIMDYLVMRKYIITSELHKDYKTVIDRFNIGAIVINFCQFDEFHHDFSFFLKSKSKNLFSGFSLRLMRSCMINKLYSSCYNWLEQVSISHQTSKASNYLLEIELIETTKNKIVILENDNDYLVHLNIVALLKLCKYILQVDYLTESNVTDLIGLIDVILQEMSKKEFLKFMSYLFDEIKGCEEEFFLFFANCNANNIKKRILEVFTNNVKQQGLQSEFDKKINAKDFMYIIYGQDSYYTAENIEELFLSGDLQQAPLRDIIVEKQIKSNDQQSVTKCQNYNLTFFKQVQKSTDSDDGTEPYCYPYTVTLNKFD